MGPKRGPKIGPRGRNQKKVGKYFLSGPTRGLKGPPPPPGGLAPGLHPKKNSGHELKCDFYTLLVILRCKNRLLATIRPFRLGVDLAQVKNRVFWSFWAILGILGKTAEIPWLYWDHFWMTSGDTYEGWSTVFFQWFHSKGIPRWPWYFNGFAPKCPKLLKMTKKHEF